MLKKKVSPPSSDMSFEFGASVPKSKKAVPTTTSSIGPNGKKKTKINRTLRSVEAPRPKKKVTEALAEPAVVKAKIKKRRPPPELVVEDEPDTGFLEPDTKPPTMELVVPVPKRISKLKTKNMRSILGDDAERIQQLLETDDSDSATKLLNKRMIQALVDLIPYAEHNVRQSKGRHGVYQINSLMQSIRELVIDLQSTQDRGAMGQAIAEDILRPAFLDMATTVVSEYMTMITEVKDLLPVDVYAELRKANHESRTRVASMMQTKYEEMRDRTIAFLQR